VGPRDRRVVDGEEDHYLGDSRLGAVVVIPVVALGFCLIGAALIGLVMLLGRMFG
jgi:hypothetical protein